MENTIYSASFKKGQIYNTADIPMIDQYTHYFAGVEIDNKTMKPFSELSEKQKLHSDVFLELDKCIKSFEIQVIIKTK